MKQSTRKYIKIAVIVFAALVVLAGGYLLFPKSYITVSVAPSQVSMTIDGGKPRTVNPGDVIFVIAGKHSYTFSRQEFAPSTVTLESGNNESKEILLELTPTSDKGSDILFDDTDASKVIQERIAGRREGAFVESATTKYPVLKDLPIVLHSLAIYSCASEKYPGDGSKVALCVYSDDPEDAKAQVPDVLAEKGYRAADYEIIYEDPEAAAALKDDQGQ